MFNPHNGFSNNLTTFYKPFLQLFSFCMHSKMSWGQINRNGFFFFFNLHQVCINIDMKIKTKTNWQHKRDNQEIPTSPLPSCHYELYLVVQKMAHPLNVKPSKNIYIFIYIKRLNSLFIYFTLLRTSLAISYSALSLPELPPPLPPPPWVSSSESNSSFVCCRSLEMSTFSCIPNTSGCCVTGRSWNTTQTDVPC